MNILRRISTLRLVASASVLAVVAIAAGVALARSGGPVPPKRPLPVAIHDALAGSRIDAVTARIAFTDHLLPSGALGSASPLLTGASGRLWAGDGRFRLELQADNGDTEIGFDGHTVIVYDVASSTAYEMAVPQRGESPGLPRDQPETSHHGVPSIAAIRRALARAAQHVLVSGAVPTDVGGQPAYSVRVSPRHDGGLLGAVELAFDARHGVPLRVGVYAQGDSSPVLQLAATDISYGPVDRSALAVHLAPGTKIVRVHPPARPGEHATPAAHRTQSVSGVAAVQKALPFTLAAPASLVGVPRQAVRLVGGAGSPTAVVVYGHGLGAIVVVEQKLVPEKHSPFGQLPSVAINGASGRELSTALGTLIRFDRDGVRYTVVGSLPAASAEAAARAIR